MKLSNFLSTIFNEEFSLYLYIPVLFLKEQPGVFKSLIFSDEEKLKLYLLDNEGCLYSTTKFSPSFLKKLDNLKIGFMAFKYVQKGDTLKYALILKSFQRKNPKYIPLK